MPAGGYQKPSNPAPASGPGAMSKRTDGGPGQPVRDPGGLPYGENQDLHTTQAAAPMSGQSPQAAAQSASPFVGLTGMSPNLFDPTNRPNEPVTSGMPFGPGVGSEAIANPMPSGPTQIRLKAYLPVYIQMAESPYVSPEFKSFVAYIRSVVNG